MEKSEQRGSFDYSYIFAVGGIGIIACSAALMFGLAYGEPVYGYYASALILLFTAFIIIGLLKGDK